VVPPVVVVGVNVTAIPGHTLSPTLDGVTFTDGVISGLIVIVALPDMFSVQPLTAWVASTV
jgi:hypothetical protein